MRLVTDKAVVAPIHTSTLLLFSISSSGPWVTTWVLESVIGPQLPVAVSVSVAVPWKAAGGVQVAFRSVAEGEKVPPASDDQMPPVALLTLPPSGALVPPLQNAGLTDPALDTGGVVMVSKAPFVVALPLLLIAVTR